MNASKDKSRAVATLHVAGAARMTRQRRQQIATWLRKQAEALQSDGDRYAARFRARYLCG